MTQVGRWAVRVVLRAAWEGHPATCRRLCYVIDAAALPCTARALQLLQRAGYGGLDYIGAAHLAGAHLYRPYTGPPVGQLVPEGSRMIWHDGPLTHDHPAPVGWRYNPESGRLAVPIAAGVWPRLWIDST